MGGEIVLSYSLTDEEIEEFIRESEELSGDETLKALMA